jgi:hypothetical protein
MWREGSEPSSRVLGMGLLADFVLLVGIFSFGVIAVEKISI